MRRAVVITFALLASLLGACSTALTNDRYAGVRSDPFLWWLSGAPQPYDLNWPRYPVQDLPILNPAEYTAPLPPRPLDVPRGWNPDYPPYQGTGDERSVPDSGATADAAQACAVACDVQAPPADRAAAGPDVRAAARDSGRASQH
jgi:hypothetical protein